MPAFTKPAPPDLVRGTFERDGKLHEYAYMAARATIFDQELVTWANRREAELESKRAAA